MRHIDFSPLHRSTVGFDRLFSMLDGGNVPDQSQTFPPYNIERTGDDAYRITMAVAGFDESEITIESKRNQLAITGERADASADGNAETLYRGIAGRNFERRFHLADYVEVVGAELRNGLLHINLKREIPEEMKPRKIAISVAKNNNSKQIESKVA